MIKPEILLHPNIPKPLHGLAPRTILGEEWWNEERQKAYAQNNYHCWACGVHKLDAKYHRWLEAHEYYEIDYPKGTMTFVETVALCHSCHNYIHCGRLQKLFDRGEISYEKFRDILRHGDNILAANKLVRHDPPKTCAPWGKWRLVLDGKKYKGKFKDFDSWKKFYE